MTIKIKNQNLYDTDYIETIIKEKIPTAKITPADAFGNIKVKYREVLAEVHCEIINQPPFVEGHDPFSMKQDPKFLDIPISQEENEIEGSIEIKTKVKTSYWMWVIILSIPFKLFLWMQEERIPIMVQLSYYATMSLVAIIPVEIKRNKFAKDQKKLKKLLVDLINKHNLNSPPEEGKLDNSN